MYREKKAINIALYGLLIALAMVLSFVETLIPIPIPVPGVKLGLANLVTVVGLYLIGIPGTIAVTLIRIVLVGLSFGNPYSMIYGLSGSFLSLFVMAILKKTGKLSQIGISVLGGIASMDAARLAGLNPKKIITTCYVMMGILCSIGGIIFAARMNSGQPAANVNLEFDAITAVILGGVSFVGGVGNMGGTILGIILIQSFNTGLTMVNVPSFWQYVAKGGLLLFALTTDYIRKQKREKDLLAASMKNL